MYERMAFFESEDGSNWKKVNKHFEDVLSNLLLGEKVRCVIWPEDVYLVIKQGLTVIVDGNFNVLWHWNPSKEDLNSLWEIPS